MSDPNQMHLCTDCGKRYWFSHECTPDEPSAPPSAIGPAGEAVERARSAAQEINRRNEERGHVLKAFHDGQTITAPVMRADEIAGIISSHFGTMQSENTALRQDLVDAIALRDKWINYAFVGEVVPPLANGRKRELPTKIESLRQEVERLRRNIAAYNTTQAADADAMGEHYLEARIRVAQLEAELAQYKSKEQRRDTLKLFDEVFKDVKVRIGLEQQGHIPTVEKMLAEGKSWQEIGDAIGWDGATAKQWYGFYLERKAKEQPAAKEER